MKYLENQNLELISRQLNGVGVSRQEEYFSDDTGYSSKPSSNFTCKLESYSCKMTSNEKKEYKKMAIKLGKNPKLLHQPLAPPQHGSISVNAGNIKNDKQTGLTFLKSESISENSKAQVFPSDTHVNSVDHSNHSLGLPNQHTSSTSLISHTDSETGYTTGQNEAEEEKEYTCLANQKTLFYLRSCLTTSFYPDYDFSDASAEEFSGEPNYDWVRKHVDNTLGLCLKDNIGGFERNFEVKFLKNNPKNRQKTSKNNLLLSIRTC